MFINLIKKENKMKKKHLYIISSVLVLFLFAFGIIGDPNADMSPNIKETINTQMDTIPPAGFPYPTQFNFNYASIPGMNAGTVGAMFFNGKYYFNRWNGTWVYRYNNNGPGGGPGTLADSLPYVGSLRDLTTDGTFIYGGNSTTTVHRLDPNTMTSLKTFTLTGGQARALAWDPNRKGFWNSGFSGNILFHDTNGVLVTQITSTLTGKYGLGFDSTSTPGQAFLWVWNQGNPATTNSLVKYNIATGALVSTYTFNLTGTSIGIAGGMEVISNAIPGTLSIMCNWQNFALTSYKLADLGPPVPSGTWTEQTSGLTTALYSVSAVDDNVAWASGASGKVLRTTNKGASWTSVGGNIPTTAALYNIFGWDANTALTITSPSAGGSVTIYKTSNGGTNWTSVYTLTAAGAFGDAVWMTSASNAFYYGDPVSGNWHLLKSTDGGNTWSTWATVATGAAGWNNGMFINGNNVYLGGNSSYMMYSSNLGVNWSQQTTPTANSYTMWFNDANNGISGDAGLFKTTNGGTNWATLPSTLAANLSGVCGAANSWWVTGQNTNVLYSSNGGTNWATQYTATTGNFYHLTKSRAGATIWGVRSNGGISRYGQPIIGITPGGITIPNNYELSQNYPNPFNPVTKINFAIPKAGLVTLKVYDVVGREITTLVNEFKNAGTYIVDFDASKLASGVYFYKIEINGFKDLKKMMVIK
jgi:photosystem II stability/assembly factor-like uncharacterized protein